MDEFFKGLNEKLKDPSLTREQKVKLIQQADDTYRQNVDKEYKDYRNKQILGAALEIGSAAIPFGGVSGQVAKRVIPKVVQKTVGRKLTTDTAAGAIGGALGSGMYGAGEGLMKGENPIKSAAKQAQSGFLSGGLLGSAIAKGENLARKVNTEGINQMRQYWGIPWQKASGDPQKAIDTLMENQRGFVPNVYNKPGVGKFDIPWGTSNYGLAHALERRAPQNKFNVTEFVNSIPNTIENGLVTKGSDLHPDTKNIISTNQKLAINPDFRLGGVTRNWLTTAIPQGKKARKHLGDLTPSNNISSENGSFSAPSISELLATDSINDYLLKHNPSQRLAPQIATFNTAVNSKMNDLLIPDELKPFLEKHAAQNKSAKKLLEDSKPFQNIASGNGTRSIPELLANNSINDYLLKNNSSPVLNARVEENNFAGYKNPHSGSNRIFAAEEIGDFSTKEFTDYEPEIFAQINTPIGAPSRSELRSAIESSTAVYVEPYYKSDGSYVKGHYRAR